ncbi:MAG TPA: hypothetical protein VF656_09940 [Pyrinomonadaceae bacterium]|jgi:Flp pilus assembly protein CpaB
MTLSMMLLYSLALGLSVGGVCFLYLKLAQTGETATTMPPPPLLGSATRDLPAFHRLNTTDVEWAARADEEKKAAVSAEKDEDFKKCLETGFVNCLLLSEVKEGEVLKSSFVRSTESEAAKLFSEKTVEAAIPANSSTTLGGRLKAGDVVDILWFRAADSAFAEPKCVDKLIVTSVPAGKVPDAPAPAAPASAQKKDDAETAADNKPPAETKTPPAAVIGLKLRPDQFKYLTAATMGGSKWMLAHKTHLSRYKKENDVSLCPEK